MHKVHHIIKKVINDIIKDYPFLVKIKTIKINDPESKNVIDYEPDYAIKRILTKHTYYFIIFEIIDKQDDAKTMADIARILAKPEIKKAIFISCNETKSKETDRIISVLIGAYKEIFKKKSKKEMLNVVSIKIINDNEKEIKKLIVKQIKEFLRKK